MNKTKIIATIGPASSDETTLKSLITDGMDVVRLNLTHADYDFCTDVIDKIHKLNEELKTNVSIMLDTEGPNVRVGKFVGGKAFLAKGDYIRIYMEDLVGDSTKFSVNYKGLLNDVKYNSILKLDDGMIELEVVEKGTNYLLCEVLKEGVIEDNKGLNAPGIKLSMPFLSSKDKNDILYANQMKVDFLALSFVSSAEDVLSVNDILIDLNNDHIGIIAKIENERAVEEIDDIIKVSDGIMIARGDLGVEVPMERVPGIQKSIISKCHNMGKVSIVATELLATMETNTRPTRAEVSDVANAVLDGADAVMLSGETTVGKFPIETLSIMEKIIESAEEDINYLELLDKAMRTEKQDITGMIAYSVAECADRLKCKAIIAPTISGYTARKMSRFRPSCPIIAVSPDMNTVKSLNLHFGVTPVLIEDLSSFDKIIKRSKEITKSLMDTTEGDKIIVTGGYPFKEVKHTNFMKIEEL
ncbi:MAG: pyruvate kinase [Bacilli bacterium]|jgi:pyruvate kinase|nr:pyruvate kinase [Bacilli bacterium]